VRAFDLPVELRRPGLDVDVPDALVSQVPVEQRLELMPAVRAHRVNPERELPRDAVDEVDRVLLRVAPVDLEGPHPRGVIDRRVLVAPNPPPSLALQRQELHVDLDLVPGDLLLIAKGVHRPPADPVREPVHPVALERPVHRGIADPDAVVALQVPDDADGPQVVGPPQVEDLLHDRGGRGLGVGVGAGWLVDQPRLALPLIGRPPHVEQRPRDAEVAARLAADIAAQRRMLQRAGLAPNILDTVSLLPGRP